MKNLSIIIVDDHALMRKGLTAALSAVDTIGNIYEAADGVEFLQILEKHNVDIALMDISMPRMDGLEATSRAMEKFPDLKIIALSMHDDMDHYKNMIDAGVKGFLSKDADLDDVIEAISTVAKGNKTFSQELLYKLVKELSHTRQESNILTRREKEVLDQVSLGLSNQQIADKLHISKRTVDKHRENILAKTGTRNTADLIMFAIKNKLI